jgi:hypothetical protein
MSPFVRAALRFAFLVVVFTLFAASAASAQTGTTALFVDSQPGDTVGGGITHTLDEGDASFSVSASSNRVSVQVTAPSFTPRWFIDFSVPAGHSVAPGEYINARLGPFSPFAGLSVSHNGAGCSESTGRFVIHEVAFGPTGSVTKFAADFEVHCNDAVPGLFGALRFQSSIGSLSPFDGDYPSYSITVAAPTNGNVSSPAGISCGAGGVVCQLSFGAAQSISLTAAPDPGFLFAGWTDGCSGGTTTTLHVNGPKVCSARFESIAQPERSLVVIDSMTGDVIGGGGQQVYSPANGNSRVTTSLSFGGSSLTVNVDATDPTDTIPWSFRVAAPSGQTLQPGTYEGALSSSSASRPGITARGVTSCTSSGRFVIHELVFGSGGTIARLAMDLEHHCSTNDAGLFAAIRINSTVTDVVPFDGEYPVYRLTLTPPAHGTITGGTLNCGSAGATCVNAPGVPEQVTLTATPDTGYLFAGWIGDCFGTTSAVVRINTIRTCSAAFEPIVTTTPRTMAFVDEMAGATSTSSAARISVFSSLATRITAASNDVGRRVQVTVAVLDSSGFTDSRTFAFKARLGEALAVGKSYAPTWEPFSRGTPGFDNDFTCSRFTGRFLVRDLALTGEGTVTRLAIDFEQHCEGRDAAIFGAVRFNSTIDARPFDGAYPGLRLAITRPAHGRVTVTSAGIDCRAATGDCDADFLEIGQATLTATPDPGFDFAGWDGACHGGAAINVNVNGVVECEALFEPTPNPSRTRLTLVSQLGEPVLQGRTEIYSLANSAWSSSVVSSSSTSRISFAVHGRVDLDEETWDLTFSSRDGTPLQPGTYTNANNSFSTQTAPFLEISGTGFCSVVGSRFTIRELTISSDFKVVRAAIDFEQHCGSAGAPALTGTIEYTSPTEGVQVALDKRSLSFASMVMPDNSIGNTTAPQAVRLTQTGAANVSWSVTTSDPALKVTPASGFGPRTLTVGIEPGIAGIGAHTFTFTVTAGATTLPVTVVWTLLAPDAQSAPFGKVETPVALSQDLTGSVPVTGWALDDIEVTDVQIWRQAHPSDPPAAVFPGAGPAFGKVFVGSATIIDGARPDVEAAFPSTPNRSRAGWGYMLLTRGLAAWEGQGLFTLHAIAIDRDGHVAEIGSTSLSVNNALATRPFGTIDTPGQGALASGLYANTGWVLSPLTGVTIPAANVRVMVDGVLLPGVPSTAPRSDITAQFPGMDTSAAGRGLFIDTRTYADGMHTIAWIVTDSAGGADGIGSRFFRIANGGLGSLKTAEQAAARAAPGVSADAVDAAPASMAPIGVRHGFDPETPFEILQGSSERFAVDAKIFDRVEVKLPAADGATYGGYLRALGELRPLPAGAAIDPSTGTFTWQPAAGYIGAYDFVFVATGSLGVESRHEVRVTLEPQRR